LFQIESERMRVGPALAVLILFGGARANADDAADAKAHYQKATAHFAIGEYREAAAEYEAAFKLKQDPALLFDAAQAHRLGGDNQRALLQYKNVINLYPGSSYARNAQERMEKLEQAMAAAAAGGGSGPVQVPSGAGGAPSAPAATTAVGAGEAGGATTDVTGAPPSPPPVPAVGPIPAAPPPSTTPPVLVAATPAEAPRPIYKRWWFWTAAGAVVAAGVVVAIVESGKSSSWSNVPDVHGGP
jgi:hypothetical protein